MPAGLPAASCRRSVAAGAETCGEADIGQFAHELVGEGAGFGDQSERAAADDAVGDDAQIDAGVAERDETRAVRSDDAHALLERQFDEVCGIGHRNAFSDDHDEFDAGFDGFDTADLANFGGTNTTLALAPVASRASPQVANTGMFASTPFLAPGKVTDVPALRGFTPPTILVPALSMRAVWVMP